ncbi:MAG: hypothetical protein WCP22_13575 [Chlamydiota bacterium]
MKFKNGSVMPCIIVREAAQGITVESYGVRFELAREEIEYYGDAAKCPGMSAGEVVAEGKREIKDRFQPAVSISPPKAAPTAAQPAVSREARFRAHQRKAPPPAAPAASTPVKAAPPAPSAPVSAITLADLQSDPARYQGQRLVFSKVKLGALQHHQGFYGIELLPAQAQKGVRRHGGSSMDLTTRGVTFVLTESQAKDLQEHSQQFDRARLEFAVEGRVIGNVRYWVAPVSRLDLFRGEGDEIAWTIW